MFCDAIVTTNSGSPSPTSAPASRAGAVSVSCGSSRVGPAASAGSSAITTPATASAPGTAHGRAKRMSSAHTRITGPISSGSSTAPWTGARHTGSSTPASIALASDAGIAATQRPSVRHRPARTISTPASMNAPSAAG